MKKRIEVIDIAKGLTIIMVVVGHTAMPLSIRTIFAGIPVPLFFIISGYLFNQEYCEQQFKNYLFKRIITLIIPYLFIAFFTSCFLYLLTFAGWDQIPVSRQLMGYLKSFGEELVNVPLWFLTCLFCALNIFYFVIRFTLGKSVLLQLFIVCVLGVSGVIVGMVTRLYWNLDVALAVQPFLYLGFIMKTKKYLESSLMRNNLIFLFLFVLFIVSVIYNAPIDLYHRIYKQPLLFYLGSTTGAILILKACYYIQQISLLSRLFIYLGKESLAILCLHSVYGFVMVGFLCFITLNVEEPSWYVYWIGSIIISLMTSYSVRVLFSGMDKYIFKSSNLKKHFI